MNILVSDSTKADRKDVQGYCIAVFFDTAEIRLINAFAKEHGGRENVSVFFRGQLLELIRWAALLCVDLPGDGNTFDDPSTRRSFARAALMASELWGRRIYGDRLASDRPVAEVRRDVLPLIRLSNMECAPCPHPLVMLARGASLFADRLLANTPLANDHFCTATGMAIHDYLAIVADLAAQNLGRDVDGLRDPDKCGLFNANAYESAPGALGRISRQFFAREAQTAQQLRQALWGDRRDADESGGARFDLQPLRARPIFRADDGRAIILDPKLFVERASAGPLFHLVRSDPTSANRWFAAFGDAFEEYAQSLFDRMFPPADGLVARFIRNPEGRDSTGNAVELGDGLLLTKDVAYLFEMKGAWMPDSATSAGGDSGEYLHQIRRRYGVVDNATAGERPVKGVGQLARAIARIANGSLNVDGVDLRNIKRLVPVLLVHDPHLDAPVHSHVLAQEFIAALEAPHRPSDWKEATCGPFNVAHLVLLTIDDLEILESSIRHFGLGACLDDYAAAAPDRLMSFHNFLATSPYRKHLRHNAWLASRCIDLLDRSMTLLYPGERPGTGNSDDRG